MARKKYEEPFPLPPSSPFAPADKEEGPRPIGLWPVGALKFVLVPRAQWVEEPSLGLLTLGFNGEL